MTPYVFGVDNGISGAVVALAKDGRILFRELLPSKKNRTGTANELDPVELRRIIAGFDPEWAQRFWVVEEPAGSQSAKAGISMAGSFHTIRSLMELHGCAWRRVTPNDWHKGLLKIQKRGAADPKKVAMARARDWWPQEQWLPTPRHKTPHDGLVDAAMLAEYGRLVLF